MRKFYRGIAVLLLAGMLTGCGAKQEAKSTDTKEKQTIVFADTQCPTNLDLAESWNSWYTSRYGITETLFKLDEQLEAQPWLAESCEKKDNLTWEITLKDDITFQNGKKMDAQAVLECWNRTMDINARFQELLFIDSMKADGNVLTVTTTQSVPAFVNSLTDPLTGIIDVSEEDTIAETPVGTGPYKAVSYEVKSEAVVERYEDYWNGMPKMEEAVFKIIADTNALTMAQQKEEVDISVTIPGSSLELFEDEEKYVVDGVAGARGQVIFMNYDNPWIQDLAVRKAISMSIDKESYANVLNKGASVPTNGLYPDFMNFGKEEEAYTFDVEGAKKVLKDAGYEDTNENGIVEKDGEDVSLRMVTYTTKAELPKYCEQLSSQLKEVGIDLKVETYESVAEQQETGDFDLMMISFNMVPTGDPLYFANIAFQSEGSSNYGHYFNKKVDELIGQMANTYDAEERSEIAKQVQDEILKDAGFIVVGHSKFVIVMRKDVQGLSANPSEYYLLDANVSIEK